MIRQRIAVIGATGSVGTSVLDICRLFPEQFDVVALAAYSNQRKLLELGHEFKAINLCLTSDELCESDVDKSIRVGAVALQEFAFNDEIDHIVFASSGVNAIKTLETALRNGKTVSLANKESIVVGGPWIMPCVSSPNQLRPVDSEHSAIWQCLRDTPGSDVERIWLTASGGPFRDIDIQYMDDITPEQALCHPVWNMGDKITIDSATLMNKGIECIEAMQLFNLEPGRVSAYIHPGSLVHGLVMFRDTTVKLLMSPPDMKLPSAAALAYPFRLNLVNEQYPICDITQSILQFSEINRKQFPCFRIAEEVAIEGGAFPALLIGADEIAVDNFISGKISFTDIPKVIEKSLNSWSGENPSSLEDAIALVDEGRRICTDFCAKGKDKCIIS